MTYVLCKVIHYKIVRDRALTYSRVHLKNFNRIMIVLQVLVVYLCSVTRILADQNDRPIIGIAVQEFGLLPTLYRFHLNGASGYIAASYVKAVESSGARVVPILTNQKEQYYRHLLGSINGVLLPGGACLSGPGHPYYDSVNKIYKIAAEMNNRAGTIFPVLGVCLGYEFLITAANNGKRFLKSCNIDYENLSLNFTQPPSVTALYGDADESLLRTLTSDDVTVNHHQWCALEEDFKNSSLNENWLITSLSTSAEGLTFIASVEHDMFPLFGIQFHPEKVAFEWNETFKFPHSREAVVASRLFYDTFIKFSKQNFNTFRSTVEERKSLIYNYPAVVDGTEFEQIYLF